MTRNQATSPIAGLLQPQHGHQGFPQQALLDGFKQIARTTQRLQPGGIPALPHGGQDDDFDILENRIGFDEVCHLLTIHIRHL